jgi:hypothetical protein
MNVWKSDEIMKIQRIHQTCRDELKPEGSFRKGSISLQTRPGEVSQLAFQVQISKD